MLGRVLEEAGYAVEYISAGYYPQVQGVADGDIHMALGLWSSNIGEGWMELFDSGQVLDAGEIGYTGIETWYANKKALEVCPGLATDYKVLHKCAQALATAETFPKGRLLDYPIEWGVTNELRIAALDLPLVSQPAGSEGALIAEIKSAHERGEPLLIQFWSPHGILADYPLTEVGSDGREVRSPASLQRIADVVAASEEEVRSVIDPTWEALYRQTGGEPALGGRLELHLDDGRVIAGEKAVADAHTHGAHPMDRDGYREKFRTLASPMLESSVLEAFLTLADELPGASPEALDRLNPSLPAGKVRPERPDGRGIFDHGLVASSRSQY